MNDVINMNEVKEDNQRHRNILIFTFGQLVGDMLTSVEPKDLSIILKVYNISDFDIAKLSNDAIKNLMKDIMYHHPKYCNRDIEEIMSQFGATKDLIVLNEKAWYNKYIKQ